jgi:DNA-directed RNA polymerase subunit RPC12/RpoP
VAMSHRQFLIKLNRRIQDSVCVVCWKSSELDVGPELFTSEGGHVCPECGREVAPELAALLGLAKAAEHYIAVIFESADRAEHAELEV